MRKTKASSKAELGVATETGGPLSKSAHAGRVLGNLAQRLEEGISIGPALAATADAEDDATSRTFVRALAARVREGEPLADALARHPDWLESAYVEAIREGEAKGSLVGSLWLVVQRLSPPDDDTAVSVFEVAEFSREFASMVGSGTSLVRSLLALEEQQSNPAFKRIIQEINEAVQKGHTLSRAMGRYPRVFDEPYINAIRTGELNGTLDTMLSGLTHLDDIVTFDQAVQFLGTSKATLYRLLNEDNIKGLRVGRQWRFRKADLRAYLEKKPATVSQTAQEVIEEELRYFETLMGRSPDEPKRDESDPESGVIQLVNDILRLALDAGASDIHLEMARLDGQMVLLLRQRLDGMLHEVRRLPEKLSKPIFNRLKVMADLNLEERMVPQDGRFYIKRGDKNYDLRVNLTPSAPGGSMVMRILDQSGGVPSFDQIGLRSADNARLREWLNRPNGVILIAGPTGSGKTTVLYSALQLKVGPAVKTVTIEDPVELMLPYATQVHVTRKAGLTFASALRAFLRQDPDIIMIGEIRDPEVAEIAHQAAQTGHLVLSTHHAGSAGEAARRMVDLEVQPFVVASALIGTVSLRLVRRNCHQCSTVYEPSTEQLEQLRRVAAAGGYTVPADAVLTRGQGCDKCRGTGFRGRIGVYELLEMNEKLGAALSRGAGADEIQEIAIDCGMTTMAADGARKVVEGVTTVEEVLRVLLSSAGR